MPSGKGCDDAHIVITGPMGAGKTTVGQALSERLDRAFFDSDAQIEAAYGTTSGTLARERGVEWLHELEAEALRRALQEEGAVVVAAAASIGDRDDLDRLLSGNVLTVLLDGRADVLVARARTGGHRRTLTTEEYRALSDRRRRALARHIDVAIDVTHLPPHRVVEQIVERCG